MMITIPKLYMVLLGSLPPGRNVEQHDFFFGIADSLGDLVPQIKAFWPQAGTSLHIDGWREVTQVDGYSITVHYGQGPAEGTSRKKLFFVNLGGYRVGQLAEQHYTLLSVQDDRIQALKTSKDTEFFKTQTIRQVRGANAHIDEKYGIDVDEYYRIEDLLAPALKAHYFISINASAPNTQEDDIHLGYFKLDKL